MHAINSSCQQLVSADKLARVQVLYPYGSLKDTYFEDHFLHPVWRDEKMHSVALGCSSTAVDAIATSGRPARTGQHVLLRKDDDIHFNGTANHCFGCTSCSNFSSMLSSSLETIGYSKSAGLHAGTEDTFTAPQHAPRNCRKLL